MTEILHQDATVAGRPRVRVPLHGRRTLRHFLIALIAAAVAVFAVGWFTRGREVAHGAMTTVAVFAFLPFAIIAVGLGIALFLIALSSLVALFGGGDAPVGGEIGEVVAELGIRIMPGYYRWLASRRHPVFWGVPLGILLGGLTLWGALAVFVLPGETATAQILGEVQQRIETAYREQGGYPRPTAGGHLTWKSLGCPERGDLVLDGFGRPLNYEVSGAWKLASYRLRSLGFDGEPGRDDLGVSGATALMKIRSFAALEYKGNRTWAKKLSAIRDLRDNATAQQAGSAK